MNTLHCAAIFFIYVKFSLSFSCLSFFGRSVSNISLHLPSGRFWISYTSSFNFFLVSSVPKNYIYFQITLFLFFHASWGAIANWSLPQLDYRFHFSWERQAMGSSSHKFLVTGCTRIKFLTLPRLEPLTSRLWGYRNYLCKSGFILLRHSLFKIDLCSNV